MSPFMGSILRVGVSNPMNWFVFSCNVVYLLLCRLIMCARLVVLLSVCTICWSVRTSKQTSGNSGFFWHIIFGNIQQFTFLSIHKTLVTEIPRYLSNSTLTLLLSNKFCQGKQHVQIKPNISQPSLQIGVAIWLSSGHWDVKERCWIGLPGRLLKKHTDSLKLILKINKQAYIHANSTAGHRFHLALLPFGFQEHDVIAGALAAILWTWG